MEYGFRVYGFRISGLDFLAVKASSGDWILMLFL